MKLALVMHNVKRTDGQGRVGYEIARYALCQGAQVSLFADRVDQDLIDLGAVWNPIQPRLRYTNLLTARQSAQIANRVLARKRHDFDVIQGFGYTLTLPHHVSGSQFVHDAWARCPAHASRVHRNLYGLYQWTYTHCNCRWERQAYAQAQVIVACSNQVRQELIAIGVPIERIRVILNAVDAQEFQPGSANRAALGLPEGVPLALFAGDIRLPRKNLDTVLRALPHVPGLHLAVVGATDGSPYPRMAAQMEIADRVHFLGFRRDMAELMRAADVFVFPSRYEPFGIVVLEAMATGLPVITACTVGAAQLITPSCGIALPDADDAMAMAMAMRALMADPARCKAMGQAARIVAERQNWMQMAQAYWNLYEEIHNNIHETRTVHQHRRERGAG